MTTARRDASRARSIEASLAAFTSVSSYSMFLMFLKSSDFWRSILWFTCQFSFRDLYLLSSLLCWSWIRSSSLATLSSAMNLLRSSFASKIFASLNRLTAGGIPSLALASRSVALRTASFKDTTFSRMDPTPGSTRVLSEVPTLAAFETPEEAGKLFWLSNEVLFWR